MQKHLARCDCVIEVHDSRIPHLGRNSKFELLQSKPRLVVLNKTDLASKKGKTGVVDSKRKRRRHDAPASAHPAFDAANCNNNDDDNERVFNAGDLTQEQEDEEHIARGWGEHDQEVIQTNCRLQQCPGVLKILPTVLEMVDEAALSRETPYLRLMVVGIPNVGKSSLINALRRSYSGRGKAARTGNNPGVTRALQTDIKINDVPPVYLVDTPGVMIPNVETAEIAMKLALLGTLRDDLVGEETIADFLLYTLNKQSQFDYVDRFGLDGPCDDIDVVLPAVANRIGALLKGGEVDRLRAAQHMLIKYREGNLGRFALNPAEPLLPDESSYMPMVDAHAARRPPGFAPDNA